MEATKEREKKRKKKAPWTDEEKAQLQRLHALNEMNDDCFELICDAFKERFTPNQIRSMMGKLDLKYRPKGKWSFEVGRVAQACTWDRPKDQVSDVHHVWLNPGSTTKSSSLSTRSTTRTGPSSARPSPSSTCSLPT